MTAAALLLLLLAEPENASFEDGLKGWQLDIGSSLGHQGPLSTARIAHGVARHGKLCLQLSGDKETIRWRMVTRKAPVRPGARVLFRIAARCRRVRREGRQHRNANAILMFHNAAGKRLSILGSARLAGDREWVDLHVHALAPAGSATVQAGFLLSMSGTVWIDDARLQIAAPRDRAVTLDALQVHLDRTYPHFGAPGRPRPGRLPRSGARAMLASLKDVHVWMQTAQGVVHPYRASTRPPPNLSPAAIRKRLTQVILDAESKLVGRIGRVGYAGLGSFVAGRFAGFEEALDRLFDASALIIDVRANGGGDERLAMRIAGRFTDKEIVFCKVQARDPTRAGVGFVPATPLSFMPREGRRRDPRRVVVLQGPYSVSSTEGFLMMMRALDDKVTTLGLPSRGASGNPKPFRLDPQLTVWIPTWRRLTPGGDPIEGVGIQPEVRFEAPPEAYRGADPTLEKALEILK